MEVGAALRRDRGEKIREDADARLSEAAGRLKPDFAGQLIQIAEQYCCRIRESGKTGIAADFADGAQDADPPELLEDIGVAQDGGLQRRGVIFGLMLADAVEDGGDFVLREACLTQDLRSTGAGIGYVVPEFQGFGIFGAIADKNTKIVEPGGGANHVSIVVKAGADGLGQLVEAGLVAEFVAGACLFQNDPAEDPEVMGCHRTFVPQIVLESGEMCQSETWLPRKLFAQKIDLTQSRQ
jgi:hypothetical protein